MKVRIGFGLGAQASTGTPEAFASLVDGLEARGFDSLWLSERLTGPAVDPLAGIAFAAGRTRRLKFGTSVLVLPGRNPVVLAKELASLDVLSAGRFVAGVGLGVADPGEQQAFGVRREDRGAWFDEALPLMRRLWSEEAVDHHGERFHLEGARVRPQPRDGRLDVWLGGRAPSELRRAGRLGDGWLPSFTTPDEAARGREQVEAAADAAARRIDPEHFGALIAYIGTAPPPATIEALRRRRPDVDLAVVLPVGVAALRERIEAFVSRGFSKFVAVPLDPAPAWDEELDGLADALLDLQM